MLTERKTLTEFILSEQRRSAGATGALTALLNGIRLACKRVSWLIGEGAGKDQGVEASGSTLRAAFRDTFLQTLSWSGSVAGLVCEEMERPQGVDAPHAVGPYLVAFEPLVDFRDLDVNVDAGSIFSILRAPESMAQPTAADFLLPGSLQIAAGYALYGPATMIVFSAGRGVNGFTLHRGFGEFFLTHPDLTIAASTRDCAVNAANARLWESPVQRYVEECFDGASGPRGADFRMRWVASLVAELHRILLRGGLFIAPAELREGSYQGRLRLLFEANPLAMLVAQAGGAASTGRGPLLDVVPSRLHERSPVVLGAREEVELIERYHREHDQGLEREFFSPLFNERSLFPSPR